MTGLLHQHREAHTAAAYKWENKRVDFARNTGLVFRLPDIWRDAGRKSTLRISMLPLVLVDGEDGAYHKKAGRDHMLVVPSGCGDALALHELAHALADAKQRSHMSLLPHDWIWADAYIGLLGEHMGADVAALRESYRNEVVVKR